VVPLLLSHQKDAGLLDLIGQTFSDLRISSSVLSMAGVTTRSRFRDCIFENVDAEDSHVGHPVFERCCFRNVSSRDTVTLYQALFLECRFEGHLEHLNFGSLRLPSPFFSEARWSQDHAAMEASRFVLDICGAESVTECSFLGATLVRKMRFRRDQGFIVSGENLHGVLGSLQRSTSDFDLAVTLAAPAGFGSSQDVHFCAIPAQAAAKRDDYVARVRDAGVEVREHSFV
jgi:hypothetical protein